MSPPAAPSPALRQDLPIEALVQLQELLEQGFLAENSLNHLLPTEVGQHPSPPSLRTRIPARSRSSRNSLGRKALKTPK